MKSIKEIEAFLYETHVKSLPTVKKDMTLERMWPLLDMVGNPQDKLSVIHVAGTSGKTSTCYFISEILTNEGLKVGLTVSPHISSITERLQISNQPVNDQQFIDLFNKFIRTFGSNHIDASYFELMIIFVLWAFVETGVDVAVLETGLGGMHDGTNVCQSHDKICVITEIGYDHQDILGNTLEEIAMQKAGIIHAGNQVYLYDKAPSIQRVFDERISQVKASKKIVGAPLMNQNDSLSLFQQRNWHLAFSVASAYIKQLKGTALDRSSVYLNTLKYVPGRLEKISASNTNFYLDGAHNVQKAQALVESMKMLIGDKKIPVIIAVKQGKDSIGFLQEIHKIASYLLCTEYAVRQDIPVSSIPASNLASQAQQLGIKTEIVKTIDEAVSLVSNSNEPVVLVTGSLYVLGQATRAIVARNSR